MVFRGIAVGALFTFLAGISAAQQTHPRQALSKAVQSGNSDRIQLELDHYKAQLASLKKIKWLRIGDLAASQWEGGLDRIGGKLFDIQMKSIPNKEVDWSEWERAVEFRKGMKSKRPNLAVNRIDPSNLENSDYPDGLWTFIGPKGFDPNPSASGMGTGPVTGRIGGIAISHQSPNTKWYIAGANGGVWKTTNAGATWTEISDGWDTIAVGSMEIDPNNDEVLYVGTGDFDDKNRFSMGLMITSNGGATWGQVGENEFGDQSISDIQLDPDRPGVIYVACGRGSFGSGTQGIWRTSSSGIFWTQESNIETRKLSLSGPVNGTRYLWASPTNASGLLRRSTSPASSWISVAYPGSNKLAAVSKTNPLKIYVLDQSNKQLGYSPNNGNSWDDIPNNAPFGSNSFWDQAWYDYTFETGVTSTNQDLLSAATVEHYVSRNGGSYFYPVSGYGFGETHVDYHVTVMHPTEPDTIFMGSDGGFYKNKWRNDFLVFEATSYNGLFVTGAAAGLSMFYSLATHPTAPSEVMGGLQDNGVSHARGNTSDWQQIHGADGTATAIAPGSPNYQYSTTQYAGWSLNAANQEIYKIRRSLDGMATHSVFEFPADDGPPFVPVFHVSNEALPKLYFGSGKLHRLTEQTGGSAAVAMSIGDFEFAGWITAITTAPSSPSIVYVGGNKGEIYRCTSFGLSPVLLSNFEDFQFPVTCISVDPSNPNSILVTFSGAESNSHDRVYRCTNTTAATPVFTSVSAGLPDIWTYWIERDPWQPSTVWYVANELGVFYTENAGGTWYDMTAEFGLPNVSVRQLSAEPATNRLYAATYGRGMYRMFIADTRPLLTSVSYVNASVAGGNTTPLRVTFDQVTPPQGLPVSLVHSPPSAVTAPTSYTIPGGVTSFDIPIQVALGSTNFTLTSTVSGNFGGSFGDTISVSNTRLNTFTVSPTTVVGSFNSTGTVTLTTTAPSGGAVVSLQSTNSAVASVPNSVTVPAGQSSAQFTITTYAQTTNQSAEILASLGSSIFRTINTTALSLSSVSLNPNTITGGFTFQGTVQLSGVAGQNGVTLALSSNQPGVSVPTSVSVQPGFSSATFTGETAVVQGTTNQVATITATQGLLFTRAAQLTVQPVVYVSFSVPTRVTQGSAFSVTATIDRPAPPGGISVQLASTNPRAVWFTSPTLTIPAGQSSVKERIGRAGNGGTTVQVTGTLHGVSKISMIEVGPPR